jgi:cytochrome c-type biogenesis protein CcmE
LFAENKGVVVEGLAIDKVNFTALKVLAKHDENYMPPEVIDALKQEGQWQEE